MRFRTEIEQPRGSFTISHADRIMLLGSCFSDNIGSRLESDGFDMMVNPFGPLYNPVTLGRLLTYLLDGKDFTADDFEEDEAGVSHCLDFAMRYQHTDPITLADKLNAEMTSVRDFFDKSTVVCITFGSSHVFVRNGEVVGNCHKLPASQFNSDNVDVADIAAIWRPLLARLQSLGKKVILTVSPIRHLAYGLHGSQLGKARLLLACETLSEVADYFPAYEIMLDDLRDYRFYASDMKHPSETACDYIYEIFVRAYFSKNAATVAQRRRKASAAAAHRPILNND